jgi:hypothetical protein
LNRSQFKKRVADELKHIPTGDDYQNMFRAAYHDNRRHVLASNPDLTPKGSLATAIDMVQRLRPDVKLVYDEAFFEAAIQNPPAASKPKATNRTEAQSKPETQAKTESETKSEASGKPEGKVKAEVKTKAEAKTKAEVKTKTDAQTKPESKTKPEAKSKPKPKTES